MGHKFLLRAILCIVSFFTAVEASRGASISWSRYVSSSRRFSPLSPITVSSSSPVVEGTASTEIHGYWDIVHGWGCICGVIVLGAAPLLVISLPVILEEGLFGLVVEALKWGASCEALLQDAFNYCPSLGKLFDSFFGFVVIEGDGWF